MLAVVEAAAWTPAVNSVTTLCPPRVGTATRPPQAITSVGFAGPSLAKPGGSTRSPHRLIGSALSLLKLRYGGRMSFLKDLMARRQAKKEDEAAIAKVQEEELRAGEEPEKPEPDIVGEAAGKFPA